jgi:hypothetical protein
MDGFDVLLVIYEWEDRLKRGGLLCYNEPFWNCSVGKQLEISMTIEPGGGVTDVAS